MSHEDDQKLMDSLVAIQRAYWQPNPDEKARLLAKYPDSLTWAETLRLQHLACLDLLNTPEGRSQWMGDSGSSDHEAPRGEAYDLCQSITQRLLLKESPYRPRVCHAWQGPPGPPNDREPDITGLIHNASFTHLGCVEVIPTADEGRTLKDLTFIPFDDLQGIMFARSALFRAALIYYDDDRPQDIVWMPLQYGVSWFTNNSYDHDGSLTHFCCHIDVEFNKQSLGIGIGHQDFLAHDLKEPNAGSLFGLGSLNQFGTALEIDDPKLEQKCRARGMDPAEVRQYVEQMKRDQN